jgi:hypothetical protein
MGKINFLILFFFFTYSAFAQKDTLSETLYAEPDFKGFQVDAVSLILINSFGTAFDFDLIKNFKDPAISFGVRLGAEYCDKYTKFDFGGNSNWVRFFDFNFYPRLTTDNETMRIDAYVGVTYHHISATRTPTGDELLKNNTFFIKGGFDLKVKLYKNYLGLLGKVVLSTGESFGGVGIFAGYGKSYF